MWIATLEVPTPFSLFVFMSPHNSCSEQQNSSKHILATDEYGPLVRSTFEHKCISLS